MQANYSSDNSADVLTFSWFWTDSETYLDPGTNKLVTYGSGQTLLTGITGAGMNYTFNYDFPGDPVYGTGYKRRFLRSLADNRGCAPISYGFQYAGEQHTSGSTVYTTTLPDSSTTKVDYWGYYSTANTSTTSIMPKVWITTPTTTQPQYAIYQSSGTGGNYSYYSTNGNIRSADAANVMSGSLTKVIYPEGGSTTMTYESNDYVDGASGAVLLGNGIRVKQIIDSAGAVNPMVTNYSYQIPVSTLSSGKPLSLPAYAFSVPYTGSATGNTLYNLTTVVSDNDLSDEDHTIMYSFVREGRTGAGNTLYQYYVPATYWNTSGTPACAGCTADWFPTINNVQRTTCTTATGPAAANTWGYPFAPNPNYDFERGLVQQVIRYNEGNTQASVTSYTYNRSYSPSTISGARIDDLPFPNGAAGLKSLSKYSLNYKTDELLVQETTQVFDLPGTQSKTTTVNYAFNSPNHKLLTQKQVTNSDNSSLTTNIKYVKDYTGLASSANRNVNALYNLQLLNENLPVETYQQVTRGTTTKTTGASLVLYTDFPAGSAGNYKYRPSAQYGFVNADGAASFTPSSAGGTTFTKDASYPALPAVNFTEYDYYGTLQTTDDGRHHVSATAFDNYNSAPAISVSNAAASEIAFNDFDSDMQTQWTFAKTGTSSFTVPAGSHSGLATALGTGQAFNLTLKKNAVSSNYILSAWINTTAQGSIAFSFSAASGSSTVSPQVIPNTAGTWKYQEWKVALGTITGTFTVSISASVNAGIDDVIFYPENAEVTTAGYDPVTHLKTSATNTNGISAYFMYDALRRPTFTLDENHSIVSKQTYVMQSQAQNFNPVISAPGNIHANTASTFAISGYDYCTSTGMLITWDFGDGTSPVTTALSSPPAHTYTTTGTKTVNATITSPIYGTKVLAPVSVTVGVPLVTLSFVNYTTYNSTMVSLTFSNTTTGEVFNVAGSGLANNNYTITQGVYVISASIGPLWQIYNPSTGVGWSSMLLTNNTGIFQCSNTDGNGTAKCLNVNLNTSTVLEVDINQVNCAQATQ
ncbi:PKD domain-containing protein [Mucilaginibacter flavus]|uniref:PKD domain-containing protein n=1 Tax=Mucilaginibacter flavus TaxID=931504 RepID=UPI0025B31FF7|nr:PKD domain-containing protein [Mucilaginibacter flavus]MDN3581555.1 PKD domain-containing protein [Mucilaginibacter flavus]